MAFPGSGPVRAALVVTSLSAVLAGCASSGGGGGLRRVSLTERECLARVMYFESNRSSDAGMIAVGTVVMNRLKSGRHGSSICEVVGARNQFAPGVLTKPMIDSGKPRAYRNADLVLSGKRHAGVQNAMFFHTSGYKFPYNNMRYVLVAGGNAFYDKRRPPKNIFGGEGRWPGPPSPTESMGDIMVAKNEPAFIASEPAAPAARVRPERPAPEREAYALASAAPSRGSKATYIYQPAANEREVQVAPLEPSRRPAPMSRETYAGARMASVERDVAPAQPIYQAPREDYADRGYDRSASRPSAGRIESAPLAPPPGMAAPARRSAPREDYAMDAAPMERSSRQAPKAVAYAPPRDQSPAELGWHVGAQPVADYSSRSSISDERYQAEARAAAEPDMDDDQSYEAPPAPSQSLRRDYDRPTGAVRRR